MRISDWSADVCSSDLQGGPDTFGPDPDHRRGGGQGTEPAAREFPAPDHHLLRRQHALDAAAVSGFDDVVVPAEPGRGPQAGRMLVRTTQPAVHTRDSQPNDTSVVGTGYQAAQPHRN